MLVWEGKCPYCYGNLVLSDDRKSVECEDCKYKERIRTKAEFQYLLKELGVLKEWGPKELRQEPTIAGQILLNAHDEDAPPRGDEVLELVHARRGLIEDEGVLERLRKGGFIL